MRCSGVVHSEAKHRNPRFSTSSGARVELEWSLAKSGNDLHHQPQITRCSWQFPQLQPLWATENRTNTATPSLGTCRVGHPLRKLLIRAPNFWWMELFGIGGRGAAVRRCWIAVVVPSIYQTEDHHHRPPTTEPLHPLSRIHYLLDDTL